VKKCVNIDRKRSLFRDKRTGILSLLEVITVHLQTHLDASLHIVCIAAQYYVAHFLNLSCNVLFHCFSCLWFVTGHSFLEVGAQKEIRKDKSGNRGGHHSLEISRSSKKLWIIAMDSLSACHVGSSFWK